MIDPSARNLTAGDLRAVFLPGLGMLGASLRHRGEELLGRLDAPNTGVTLRSIKDWEERRNL